jgi:hypothetical protein
LRIGPTLAKAKPTEARTLAIQDVLQQIDSESEIAKLQEVKALLGGGFASVVTPTKGKRGRPPGTKSAVKTATSAKAPAKVAKRTMSEEARKKIAEAQRLRWAKTRKATGK